MVAVTTSTLGSPRLSNEELQPGGRLVSLQPGGRDDCVEARVQQGKERTESYMNAFSCALAQITKLKMMIIIVK